MLQQTTGERVELKITDVLNTYNKQGKSCHEKIKSQENVTFL